MGGTHLATQERFDRASRPEEKGARAVKVPLRNPGSAARCRQPFVTLFVTVRAVDGGVKPRDVGGVS
jgi:hypothetical protein